MRCPGGGGCASVPSRIGRSVNMRIAFLTAQYTHKRFNENFFVVDRHFGVFPDVGLAMAASVARLHGAEVRFWDAYATQMELDEVLAQMRRWGPDLLACSFHSVPSIMDTIRWAVHIKEALGIPLLLGGHETNRYGEDVMVHDAVDHVLDGRAAQVLPPYLDALERDAGFTKVPGLIHRRDGDVLVNPPAPDGSDVADPYPARDLLPLEHYYSHLTQRRHYTVLLTSRGCPFGCTFCAMARSKYHPRPVSDVVDEMQSCIDGLDIHEFDFFDPLLLHDRGRVLDFCSEIRNRGLDMEWACRSRIDHVDEEILAAIRDAGCRRIYFGIESGDPDVLRRINKRVTLEQVHRAIEMTRHHDIHPLGFFQIGSPGETRRTARRTIRFALDLPLDYAQFMRTIAKPGSSLEKAVIRVTGRDHWREYVTGRRDDSRLPTPWTRLEPRTVDALVREAYLRFYTRPRIALKTLLGSRSPEEARRYIEVGLRMLATRSG